MKKKLKGLGFARSRKKNRKSKVKLKRIHRKKKLLRNHGRA